jgi:hypothetical protein
MFIVLYAIPFLDEVGITAYQFLVLMEASR